jgi:hypothetical protein
MPDFTSQNLKRMKLRYAGVCRACATPLPAGQLAVYDRSAQNVSCLGCSETLAASTAQPATGSAPDASHRAEADRVPEDPADSASELDVVDSGVAGASARREHERRKAKREAAVRARHPRIGGLLLALSDDPRTTKVWERGAVGEEKLAKRLNTLAEQGVRLLHDRRIRGTRANIDHIAIGASGVFVIDAKRYKGRPQKRIEGGILRPRVETLIVGTRRCDKFVEGVHTQVRLVQTVLDAMSEVVAVRAHGMLCFIEADWPLIGGSFSIADVDVLWPAKAADRLLQPGPLTSHEIDALHRVLDTEFPVA